MSEKEEEEVNVVKEKLTLENKPEEEITKIVSGFINGQTYYPMTREQLENDFFAQMMLANVRDKYDIKGSDPFFVWGKMMEGQTRFINGFPMSTELILLNEKDNEEIWNRINKVNEVVKGGK